MTDLYRYIITLTGDDEPKHVTAHSQGIACALAIAKYGERVKTTKHGRLMVEMDYDLWWQGAKKRMQEMN